MAVVELPDMGTRNPIVYLVKIISKRMQTEINEETAIVMRQKLEVREQNLQAIYQSDENREKIRKIKEAWADLKKKKEDYDKSKKGVSLYDKIVKWIDSINISLKIQDVGQLSNVALAPGIIAGKISAFIEEQKKEAAYIKRVAKSQKKIIKEDLEIYGKYLEELIDEINKGDDDYRQEILSKLDPWAQQDPYIADAPYIEIMPRYQERLASAEVKAEQEQLAGGKVTNPNLFKMPELKIRRPSADLIASMLPIERAQLNVGDNANTDDAKDEEIKKDYQTIMAADYAKKQAEANGGYVTSNVTVKDADGNIIGTGTTRGNMDPGVAEAMLQEARDAQSGKFKKRNNPFGELSWENN